MTNNPNDFLIVPKVVTPEMRDAFTNHVCKLNYSNDNDAYQEALGVALESAPPHNLVAVDKGELRTLKGAYEKIMQISTIEELQSLQSVLAAFYTNLGAK